MPGSVSSVHIWLVMLVTNGLCVVSSESMNDVRKKNHRTVLMKSFEQAFHVSRIVLCDMMLCNYAYDYNPVLYVTLGLHHLNFIELAALVGNRLIVSMLGGGSSKLIRNTHEQNGHKLLNKSHDIFFRYSHPWKYNNRHHKYTLFASCNRQWMWIKINHS